MGGFVEGKVVVITGSGSGIGRDIALGFAAEGARVVVNDLGRDTSGVAFAETVVSEIQSLGGEATASTASVANWDAARTIVEQAIDTFGQVDCVINNAGIVRDRFFFNMSVEEWHTVLDVHLNGSFNVARAAAPFFKTQGSGSYVHMTSSSGLIGNFGQANYAAAKMGIVGLSKTIALDMARFKVRSNCITPWAWTSMTATIPADTPENIARIATLRKMESSKIAPLAIYLASDSASSVSGQVFGVRANEIYLFSQPRILRSMQRSDGWTPQTIADHAMPALASSFYENVPSLSVIPWDPV